MKISEALVQLTKILQEDGDLDIISIEASRSFIKGFEDANYASTASDLNVVSNKKLSTCNLEFEDGRLVCGFFPERWGFDENGQSIYPTDKIEDLVTKFNGEK